MTIVTDSAKPAVTRRHPPNLLMRLVNPVMRAQLRRGKGGPSQHLMLLHFTGRKSGKQFDLPVAQQRIGDQLCVFTNSSWRINFRGGTHIEVTLQGRRLPMHATLDEDADMVAAEYAKMIASVGHKNARRLGITINVDRAPTHAELADAVARHGLSIIRLTSTT
ncbi:nitroreductase/quinone reductase family protein [Nonomuraea sp. LPB2021202275-12-8]|uniref:nitroreductase/quinone reductase family protein n=1 Tax=Nonomuraea sp. LPB2021202275-12-8 TaxID=3120159 RepID=UPI00300C3BC0